MIERAERGDAGLYDEDPDAAPGMAEDERGHAEALAGLRSREGRTGPDGSGHQVDALGRIARREQWHRGDRSGALRAAIFGISDGLVSNTALVMGFAGSGASRSAVLLAGVAGLLAGSFSMAAGRVRVDVRAAGDVRARDRARGRRDRGAGPRRSWRSSSCSTERRGCPPRQARRLAEQIMSDRSVALDTLVREELGLDPEALGSPWAAAFSSLVAFALGAFVVVIPYLFGGGTAAFVAVVVMALGGDGGRSEPGSVCSTAARRCARRCARSWPARSPPPSPTGSAICWALP